MSLLYTQLTPEELMKTAIGFLAAGTQMPVEMEDRLRELGLYDLVCFPLSLDVMGE